MLSAVTAFVATLLLTLVLLAVHETGHYVTAAAAGVPREKMQIHLLSVPARVEFDTGDGFAAVSQLLPETRRRLPDRYSMFGIAAGGHLAELVVAVILTVVSLGIGVTWVAIRFTLLSTFMALTYVAVSYISVVVLANPFGDPVELWRHSVVGTVLFYSGFFVVVTGLLWILAAPTETVWRFGLIVPLIFGPLALLAAKEQ